MLKRLRLRRQNHLYRARSARSTRKTQERGRRCARPTSKRPKPDIQRLTPKTGGCRNSPTRQKRLGVSRSIRAPQQPNPPIMKSIIYTAVLFTLFVLSPRPSLATDWWTLSDQDFANQYAPQAFSATIKDQSSVAWMLFARVNQPTQNQGQTISQWESWPSNDETFSPAVGLF